MAYMQIGTLRFQPRSTGFWATRTMRFFMNQISNGYSPICLVVGKQRTGKTAFAMYLAEQIMLWRGGRFQFENDMFFDIETLIQKYAAANNRVYILDEAGISLNVYEGMQLHQRVFQKVAESQAYLQNILFLVLPHAGDVGRHHRNHVDALFEVKGRGKVKFRYIWKNYADLAMKPPFSEEFEYLKGLPLPSHENWSKYVEHGQKNYKKDILDSQIAQMTQKAIVRAGMHKEKEQPLLIPRNS